MDLEIKVVMGVVGNSKSWKHQPIHRNTILSKLNTFQFQGFLDTTTQSLTFHPNFFVHTYNTSIQQQQ